jgi:hypothetical protein
MIKKDKDAGINRSCGANVPYKSIRELISVNPRDCKHEEAVYWNPYNKVVQCHKCGQVFVPEHQLESNLEFLSEQVHNAWWDEKQKQGFHAPTFHPLCTEETKFDRLCHYCHSDCYPYGELPENIKEYDRVTVRTVLNAVKKMEGME